MQPSLISLLNWTFIKARKFDLILIFLFSKAVQKRVWIYYKVSPFRLTKYFLRRSLLGKGILTAFKIGIQIQGKFYVFITEEIYLLIVWWMILFRSEWPFQRFQATALVWNDWVSGFIKDWLRNSNIFSWKLWHVNIIICWG